MPRENACRRQLEEARRENRQLKTLLIDILRTLKEIEINLQGALDKDKK
jgi:hypothetical protein